MMKIRNKQQNNRILSNQRNQNVAATAIVITNANLADNHWQQGKQVPVTLKQRNIKRNQP